LLALKGEKERRKWINPPLTGMAKEFVDKPGLVVKERW